MIQFEICDENIIVRLPIVELESSKQFAQCYLKHSKPKKISNIYSYIKRSKRYKANKFWINNNGYYCMKSFAKAPSMFSVHPSTFAVSVFVELLLLVLNWTWDKQACLFNICTQSAKLASCTNIVQCIVNIYWWSTLCGKV